MAKQYLVIYTSYSNSWTVLAIFKSITLLFLPICPSFLWIRSPCNPQLLTNMLYHMTCKVIWHGKVFSQHRITERKKKKQPNPFNDVLRKKDYLQKITRVTLIKWCLSLFRIFHRASMYSFYLICAKVISPYT